MIKTIKVKKQLRLDELIKYAWDNQLNKIFVSDKGLKNVVITIDSIDFRGLDNGIISCNDTFTVEVEEEITEDTEFEAFVVITDKGVIKTINNYHNIIDVRGLLENYEVEQKIYALIDNNLQLIWEAE